MVIPGTEAAIDYTDTASSTEDLRKDEETHIVAASFVLSTEGILHCILIYLRRVCLQAFA